MKQTQITPGKFYDKIDLAFSIGNVRCHALKFSFEPLHRSFPSHSHSSNSWEIHYISAGKGTVTLNHVPYQVNPSTLFIRSSCGTFTAFGSGRSDGRILCLPEI